MCAAQNGSQIVCPVDKTVTRCVLITKLCCIYVTNNKNANRPPRLLWYTLLKLPTVIEQIFPARDKKHRYGITYGCIRRRDKTPYKVTLNLGYWLRVTSIGATRNSDMGVLKLRVFLFFFITRLCTLPSHHYFRGVFIDFGGGVCFCWLEGRSEPS